MGTPYDPDDRWLSAPRPGQRASLQWATAVCMDPRGARVAMPPGGQADLVTDSLPAEPDGSPDDEHAVAAGALLLRLNVVLPVLAATVAIAPAAVSLRVGR